MDDENASCAHDMENALLPLLDLPVEIFLHICSFLDAWMLVYSLRLVCKQFYLILKDDPLMRKARIKCRKRASALCFVCPVCQSRCFGYQDDWKLRCFAIQDAWASGYFGSQDVCKSRCCRSQDVCKSRFFGIQNVRTPTCCGSLHVLRSPRIKDISWTYRQHDLQLQHGFRGMPNELWCISSCPERALVATGSITGIIYVFDSRASNKPIMQYYSHIGAVTKPVRKLAMNTDYIVSASVGNTVAVWDQRAGRIMKSITISGLIPTCMSMQRDWVIVGDSDAKCHMLNPKNDFELVKSYSTEHTKWITGVHLTHGCLITSSMDGTVRISSLNMDPPKPLATLRAGFGLPGRPEVIDSMDYLNETLAISGESVMTVWRPISKRY